jgi:hypothetical protein
LAVVVTVVQDNTVQDKVAKAELQTPVEAEAALLTIFLLEETVARELLF